MEPSRFFYYTTTYTILELETKASSHQGQCIPAGSSVSPPRLVLLSMSIISMRSRLFPANSASVCLLRFAKSRPQVSESCGATYKRICETFSALQSTSSPVTDFIKVSKFVHNWRCYPSSNWYEIDQKTRF